MTEMDRQEFLNALIGWLGTDEIYLNIFDISYEDYKKLSIEEFENLFDRTVTLYSNEELNQLSKPLNIRVI